MVLNTSSYTISVYNYMFIVFEEGNMNKFVSKFVIYTDCGAVSNNAMCTNRIIVYERTFP